MTTNNLQGSRLLLLRQTADNQELEQQVLSQQGSVMQWTALKIEPTEGLNEAQQLTIDQANLCVFISKNAAKFCSSLFEQLTTKTIIAIGSGTAGVLSAMNLEGVLMPKISTTEGLLEMQPLQQIAGRSVVIFKGNQGRKTLQKELQKRGAKVYTQEVYSRQPQLMTKQQAKRIKQFNPNVVQITSVATAQSLDNANQRFTLFDRNKISILTISERVRKAVLLMGYNKVINVDSMNMEHHIKALQQQKFS